MSSSAILCIFLLSLALISTSAATSDDFPTVYQVLQQYNFPVGLLPKGVLSYELDNTTGQFAVYLSDTCSYTIDGYNLKYKNKITGTISKNELKDLSGVQVKILFFWLNIVEVSRDDDELELSVGIASADFPIDSFYESPQCGCGFDCGDGIRGSGHGGKISGLKNLVSSFLIR